MSLEELHAKQHAAWRDPRAVAGQWSGGETVDPGLLRWRTRGEWWEILATTGATLLVTREYEHLVMAMRAEAGRPVASYLPLPHPSGLAFDRAAGVLHVASTRNPNVVYDLAPATGVLPRRDAQVELPRGRPLVPVRARYYPGCLYLHDLSIIGGVLHGNAVGQNAVVRLCESGGYERVWWPRAIETERGPRFEANHLQLNSIAAGADLADSYFSASGERVSRRRPGHRDYPVDGRGVIFAGATREPVARGLTRPHSARLRDGRLWVDNSGYGELGAVEGGAFMPLVRLPGWTRGLCFHGSVAFVGTSRVLTRFRQYAPGLEVERSVCGVHAVDVASGRVLGSLEWPLGNQIFALELVPSDWTGGFASTVGASRARARERGLYYAYEVDTPR